MADKRMKRDLLELLRQGREEETERGRRQLNSRLRRRGLDPTYEGAGLYPRSPWESESVGEDFYGDTTEFDLGDKPESYGIFSWGSGQRDRRGSQQRAEEALLPEREAIEGYDTVLSHEAGREMLSPDALRAQILEEELYQMQARHDQGEQDWLGGRSAAPPAAASALQDKEHFKRLGLAYDDKGAEEFWREAPYKGFRRK